MKATTEELALARAEAAEQLDAAIAALGTAYQAYASATNVLEFRVNVELSRYIENPIILHLAKAGISPFLERRLVGTPLPLRSLVEAQHRKTDVPGLRDN